jgi:hypothetical protein
LSQNGYAMRQSHKLIRRNDSPKGPLTGHGYDQKCSFLVLGQMQRVPSPDTCLHQTIKNAHSWCGGRCKGSRPRTLVCTRRSKMLIPGAGADAKGPVPGHLSAPDSLSGFQTLVWPESLSGLFRHLSAQTNSLGFLTDTCLCQNHFLVFRHLSGQTHSLDFLQTLVCTRSRAWISSQTLVCTRSRAWISSQTIVCTRGCTYGLAKHLRSSGTVCSTTRKVTVGLFFGGGMTTRVPTRAGAMTFSEPRLRRQEGGRLVLTEGAPCITRGSPPPG